MNKKVITAIFGFILSMSIAFASTKIKVSAETYFDTTEPSETMSYIIEEDVKLGNYNLLKNDILNCNIIKVTDPKRGKRNAVFYVEPVSYTRGDENFIIAEKIQGKYSKTVLSKDTLKNMDKGKAVEKTAVVIGSHFVKAIGPAISLTEGMIKNEEGKRIKSGVKQVYKDSPLSYVEKGTELIINPGDEFYLIFKDN